MSDTPVIEFDLGDGKSRRFFIGRDELRLIEQECGTGFYTLYQSIAGGTVRQEQIERIIRLALIGGGIAPSEALTLSNYYATPPRPLKPVYLLAYRVLEACWQGGTKQAKSEAEKRAPTAAEVDGLLRRMEGNFARAGHHVDLSGLSMAQVIALHDEVFQKADDKPAAPDAGVFEAIKASAKKGAQE